MKKFLCLLLVAVLCFSLCGCFGKNPDDNVRGDITSDDQNQVNEEKDFSLGKTSNNVYTNDFLGLSCTLPSEWVFYTDAQILELNNMVGDYIDQDVAERLKDANIIYDMYAIEGNTGNNINVNLEKLNAIQLVQLDIKKTLEAQIGTMKSTFANMGYTDINVVYKKITVDGKDFDALKITAKIQGIDFYATCFAFRKGNYLANVTLGSISTDKTDTILSCFKVS